MKLRILLLAGGLCCVIAYLGIVFRFGLTPRAVPPAPREDDAIRNAAVFDESFEREIVASADVATDRERMWRTVRSREFEVAPVSAINAASRVFAAVQLKGRTAEEVAEMLAVRPRPGYGYELPFYTQAAGTVVYRFDCGNFGWEFHVVFDGDGKVSEVQRSGIE